MSQRAKTLLTFCPPQIISSNGQQSKTTVFHDIWNTEASERLGNSNIHLGSLCQLEPAENPTLVDMKQAYGERTAVSWLLPHIAGLNACSGASNKMDLTDITRCCRDIIATYPYLTLAEVCWFCPRMRAMQFARNRGNFVFSAETVMSGLQEFMDKRRQAVDEYEKHVAQAKAHETSGEEISYDEYLAIKKGKTVLSMGHDGLTASITMQANKTKKK